MAGHLQRISLIAATLLAAACLGGCGYTVGPPYDGEVQTVYVDIFETDLYRRDYGFQLTEAIQRQIQTQSPLRLVNEEEADTKLSGRVISLKKRSLGLSPYDESRQLEVDLVVQVSWVDLRTGELLKQQNVDIAPDVIELQSEGVFAPEVGQSLATANQVALESMARKIVEMMESPW